LFLGFADTVGEHWFIHSDPVKDRSGWERQVLLNSVKEMDTIAGEEFVAQIVDGVELVYCCLPADRITAVVVLSVDDSIAEFPNNFELGPDGSDDTCCPERARSGFTLKVLLG
jgi:hypothetical protein